MRTENMGTKKKNVKISYLKKIEFLPDEEHCEYDPEEDMDISPKQSN